MIGKAIGYSALAVGGLFALTLASSLISVPFTAVHQGQRVVEKTLDADNVINNYEYFHDAYGNYMAKVSQAKQFKKLLAAETDHDEQSRLRIDLAAIQQSCRDLAQRYNSNADKSNRSIFMGRDVPSSLNPGECE